MFPVIKARLNDRDGSLKKEIELCRFWYAPPKVLIDGNEYYIRISDDHTTDPAIYRRTSAVRKINDSKSI